MIKTYQSKKYSDLVERIWFLENTGNELEVLSPPDQYINLIFPLDGSVWKHNNLKVVEPQIEGITLQSSFAKYPKNTKLVGIRFYAFGLASFINVSGKELINKTILLKSISNELNETISSIKFGEKIDTIIMQVEGVLAQFFILKNYNKTQLVRHFYCYFRWEHQAASIEEFCEEFGTNYTSLNRQFSNVIGISAKRFERLIKFRKALCELTETNESLTTIGFDSGYFDQSHFIREFKLFMNYSPKIYNSLIRKADKNTNIINYNFSLY